MADPHIEPDLSTDCRALAGSQSLLGLYSMPAISEIPLSTKWYNIYGNEYGYCIKLFVDPTPTGEKLVWASVNVPDPSSEAPCLLTLTPFPQGEAGDKILALLQKARDSKSKAEDILPELEMLGKEVNGIGWRPALSLPLQRRVELPPMSYISPPLEEILKKEPLVERTFVSTRNVNGKYDVCVTTLNPRKGSLTFSVYTAKDDEEPKLIRDIEAPLHPTLRSQMKESGQSVSAGLMEIAADFQELFYKCGAESLIAYVDRLNIRFNNPKALPSGASTDERLRLMRSVTPPYEFSYTFKSGTFLTVQTGDEVVSVTMKSSAHAEAAAFIANLDRAKLKLSDDEWKIRRSEFLDAARLLASESEGAQLNALTSLCALATQQATLPTKIVNILDNGSNIIVHFLGAKYDLSIQTEVGSTPSRIRRLCDGPNVLVISRAVSRLGSQNLSLYNEATFEFMPNGDLEFSARNLMGNQISGRVSAEGSKRAGGRQKVFQHLANNFGMQFSDMKRTPFEQAVEKVTSLEPGNSFYITTGQTGYLDLPESDDPKAVRAFALAERCARIVCEHARGHGKHHAGVVASGTVEARLQFPAAPYDLVLRFNDAVITQAEFIPRAGTDLTVNRHHSFVGHHDMTIGHEVDLESALTDFAKWGRDHSHKKEGIPPLEETLVFQALKRLLPDEGRIH